MNACIHESDVSRAVRTGFWPDALAEHAESCAVCSQARVVAEAFLAESTRIAAENRPPDAAQAWHEARRRARLHLHRRAAFWFRALRALTCVYVPALLVWSVSHRSAPVTQRWTLAFHTDFTSLLTGPAETFAASGILLAALCVTMGSWYLLREARAPLHPGTGR